jgi:fluoride exporter
VTGVARDASTAAAWLAVALGAVLGAWLRYGLALWLNPRSTVLPLGTLTANLVGGYLVGIAIAFVMAHPSLPPFWRLLVITGFLGGLTTFSTFSAESVALLETARWSHALLHTTAHLFGSLLATGLGIVTYRALS